MVKNGKILLFCGFAVTCIFLWDCAWPGRSRRVKPYLNDFDSPRLARRLSPTFLLISW